MKKILIISYSNLSSDPRVLRQIDLLGADNEIHTAGMGAAKHSDEKQFIKVSDEIDFHKLLPTVLRKIVAAVVVMPLRFFGFIYNEYILLRWLKAYESYYWTLQKKIELSKLSREKYDLIIANDLVALPLAIRLKEIYGSKVYFDAHEYSPLEYENNATWLQVKSPYVIHMCREYIPQADYNTTVAYGIAEEYTNLTGRHFDVVLNAPAFENLQPSKNQNGVIRFIHHGGVAADRNTDKLVEAFAQSKRADIELHLMIINLNSGYGQYIKKLASKNDKIFFHDPVPTREIARYINQFDVGIYFLPPLNFNQVHALPNKFFEFIQGRLMLAFGPSAEMLNYINKYDLGVVGKGFSTEYIMNCIDSITVADVNEYKQKVDKASQVLSAETSMHLLKENLHRVLYTN